MSEWVAVFDVDGVFTDGSFYNTKDGKFIKKFGPDDWDALRELNGFCDIHIVSADKRGFSITEKRIKDEMQLPLDLVANKPPSARWNWIKENYPNKKIIYIGDGIYDWFCLEHSDYGIAPQDALLHTRARADYLIDRKGGDRFVAEACLNILEMIFGVDTARIGEINEQD